LPAFLVFAVATRAAATFFGAALTTDLDLPSALPPLMATSFGLASAFFGSGFFTSAFLGSGLLASTFFASALAASFTAGFAAGAGAALDGVAGLAGAASALTGCGLGSVSEPGVKRIDGGGFLPFGFSFFGGIRDRPTSDGCSATSRTRASR